MKVGLSWCCADCLLERRLAFNFSSPRQADSPADSPEKQRDYSAPKTKKKRDYSTSSRQNEPTPATREKVKERDGGRCRFCQRPWNLHLHHVRYRSESLPPEILHAETNLVTLCVECHETVHSDKRRWQEVLLVMLRLGYDGRFVTVLEADSLLRSTY